MIEPGATLVVEGHINNDAGTFTINGSLQVQGGFTNHGTLTSNSGSTITILTGAQTANNPGGLIVIQSGATLVVEGAIDNKATINNDGTTNNLGVIYNCFGIFSGNLPLVNPLEVTSCPSDEICDGMDNDWDGAIDEDCGCTDEMACNYDATFLLDDGSCVYPGCTNISACNYDPLAPCDDGSCEYLTCRGCTGQMACNYDATVSIDDGSCDYFSCAGCTYSDSPDYDPTKSLDDGSCTFALPASCPSDSNSDGQINTADLTALLGVFGTTCAP